MHKAYLDLCGTGDRQYESCRDYFGSGITCRAGCGDCCVEIAVFPVEWNAIEHWLEARGSDFQGLIPFPERCVFLKSGSCSIYPIRPFICRVHGAPLMYRTEDEDYPPEAIPPEHPYQVTWCEYNFRDLSGELGQKELSEETVIDLEKLNIRLAEINYRFINSAAGAAYNLEERYTINQLYGNWDKKVRSLRPNQAGSR